MYFLPRIYPPALVTTFCRIRSFGRSFLTSLSLTPRDLTPQEWLRGSDRSIYILTLVSVDLSPNDQRSAHNLKIAISHSDNAEIIRIQRHNYVKEFNIFMYIIMSLNYVITMNYV